MRLKSCFHRLDNILGLMIVLATLFGESEMRNLVSHPAEGESHNKHGKSHGHHVYGPRPTMSPGFLKSKPDKPAEEFVGYRRSAWDKKGNEIQMVWDPDHEHYTEEFRRMRIPNTDEYVEEIWEAPAHRYVPYSQEIVMRNQEYEKNLAQNDYQSLTYQEESQSNFESAPAPEGQESTFTDGETSHEQLTPEDEEIVDIAVQQIADEIVEETVEAIEADEALAEEEEKINQAHGQSSQRVVSNLTFTLILPLAILLIFKL